MWNGAVFMPLIDEIETIDPGRPCDLSSAATAWLMKNIVSRFWANNARQSALLTRVDGIQVGGAAPPATLTSPCRSPSVFRTCSITAAMPSSVEASAATGTTERPSATRGSTCLPRFSSERLTAITVAPARATMLVTDVPMPPPAAPETTTTRPSRPRSYPTSSPLAERQHAAIGVGGDVERAVRPGGDAGEQAL